MSESTPKQICSIRIMFPVDTDEKAIEYKKKISEVLASIPDVQIHFSLMPASSSLLSGLLPSK